jgi:hypothetical protein
MSRRNGVGRRRNDVAAKLIMHALVRWWDKTMKRAVPRIISVQGVIGQTPIETPQRGEIPGLLPCSPCPPHHHHSLTRSPLARSPARRFTFEVFPLSSPLSSFSIKPVRGHRLTTEDITADGASLFNSSTPHRFTPCPRGSLLVVELELDLLCPFDRLDE